MKKTIRKLGLIAIAFILWPALMHAQHANDHRRTYTKEHPLVYTDTWDLPPYVFLNEEGQPDGYTIDVLKLLLGKLDIPYVIKLKPTMEALSDFSSGTSDLIVSSMALFPDKEASNNVALQYTFSLAYPKTMAVSINSMSQLADYQVYVRKGSRYCQHLEEAGLQNQMVHINDMSDAIRRISSDRQGLVLWNTMSIKWVLRKFQIDNLQLSNIDIPQVSYNFISSDSALIASLDSVYAIADADEALQPLQAKWFYPERKAKEFSMPRWMKYVIALAAIVAVLVVYFYVIYRKRERKTNALLHQRANRLSLILQVSEVSIWTYDVHTKNVTWIEQAGLPERVYTLENFGKRYLPEEYEQLKETLDLIASGRKDTATLEMHMKGADDDDGTKERIALIKLSVQSRDRHGKPTVILGVRRDITEEREKQLHSQTMLDRYQSIFSTSMVDMIFYDADGYVENMNERAQKTFNMDLQQTLKERINLRQILDDDHLDIEHFDYLYATEFVDLLGRGGDMERRKLAETMFYELQLIAVRDKDSRLLGIYGTGFDVSELARSQRQIREGIRRLRDANSKVTSYIENINYAMRVGGIRMANYDPATHTLTLYSQSNVTQLELTQTRCLSLIDEQDKRTAMRMLSNMDSHIDKKIDTTLLTTLRLGEDRLQLYLQFLFIPIYDGDGQLQSYFGMCRDVSEIKAKEQKLKEETERAQEVEDLKNSFLRNMSYEIRTPLSSVMGFSELLEMEHTPEDEHVFISEIKDNSSYLLNLINDILFLSRLDAHMIEFNPQPIDFAMTFESHCHMGWAKYQQPGVSYTTENPYERLIVTIDDANLGRVIEQIAANAAQYTHEGRVSARYEYVADKLIITIEDTGLGMSKKTIDSLFQRFGNERRLDTGLGMPICRELVEQMGGTIAINSQEGKGTIVWITVPCEMQVLDRKKV